ncbi:MAG: hypothetical protein LBQ93_03875 [Treponema sp.]|jgi:hypothetical protein|nr:hypothetical protein [Treponema sp.]
MVICIKCGKEQTRRSSSECEYKYVYDERAEIEHAWEDRDKFIDHLRVKLPPTIKGRIEEWRKKCANNLSLFTARMESYEKKLNELKAAHSVYLNEGLPRVVNRKKQRALRSLLLEMLGSAIGVFIVFKWFFPWIFSKFDLDITVITDPLFINHLRLGIIVLLIVFLGKSVVGFLKAKRYAESQEFADELSDEWLINNGYNNLVSTIKAEQDKWNSINNDFERHISAAERALAGSDEELLSFYNMDKQTKNYYIKNLYWGDWW